MKKFISLFAVLLMAIAPALAQNKTKEIKNKTVEASCAQCQFKVKEPRGCDLSIRLDGKIYFVDGTNLDAHGDAHEEDGFCNAIRRAKVTGTVSGNRIQVTQFELKPIEKKKS
jgi:hypothetical protein